jgi:hypothetical protein
MAAGPRTFVLYKPVTTVGRGLGNDVSIPTDAAADTHIQVLFDGRDFNLEEVDKQARSRSTARRSAARASCTATASRSATSSSPSACSTSPGSSRARRLGLNAAGARVHQRRKASRDHQQLAGLRKLYEFSEKLMTMKDIDQLLEAMLDAVIEVTGAEKGLILLNDDAFVTAGGKTSRSRRETPTAPQRIRASRNVKARGHHRSSGAISDSIVRKVIETGRPVIVSDALTDSQFNTSESVLALRLSSVMCAPLVSQGHVQGRALRRQRSREGALRAQASSTCSRSSPRRRASSCRTRCS